MTNEKAIEILKYHKCPDGKGMDCGKYSCAEHHEAIDKAVEALKATTWIPCSERLPEKLKDVLIIEDYYLGHPLEHYRNITISFYTGEDGRTHLWSNMLTQTRSRYRVLEWMPLPEMYHD